MKEILILCFLVGVVFSCDNPKVPNVNTLPGDFMFVCLDSNGKLLIDDPSTKVEFYYFLNGQKKVINECKEPSCKLIREFYTATPKYPYFYTSLEAPTASGDQGIKTFYLTIENKTDTIFLDVEKLSQVDPQTNGLYKYKKVMFNGTEVFEDKDVMPWVYLLKRK